MLLGSKGHLSLCSSGSSGDVGEGTCVCTCVCVSAALKPGVTDLSCPKYSRIRRQRAGHGGTEGCTGHCPPRWQRTYWSLGLQSLGVGSDVDKRLYLSRW